MKKALMIVILVVIAGVIMAAGLRLHAAGDQGFQDSLPPLMN